jgi:hypothetical protein
MSADREPYQFKRCMFFAWHDIKRVWKSYVIGTKQEAFFGTSIETLERKYISERRERCSWKYLPHEIRGIIMEIKHGVFDQGK